MHFVHYPNAMMVSCWKQRAGGTAGQAAPSMAGQEGAQGVQTATTQVREQCLKPAARVKYKGGSAVNMECF